MKADVNNWEEILPIMSRENLDYVFHYAAVVGVQRTLDNPMAVLKDIDGIKNILNQINTTYGPFIGRTYYFKFSYLIK